MNLLSISCMVVNNDLNLTSPAKALEKTTHFVSLEHLRLTMCDLTHALSHMVSL